MSTKRPAPKGNPDLRQQKHVPAPPIEQIEQEIFSLRSPCNFYLTNVLDPQILSAQQVCELYRRRWRVEDAFLLTKRLLGLAYIWVGESNCVQIQIFATWIFYAVLINLGVSWGTVAERQIQR